VLAQGSEVLVTNIVCAHQITQLQSEDYEYHKAFQVHTIAHVYPVFRDVVGREGEREERIIGGMEQSLAFIRFDPAEKIKQCFFHGYF
jgi:hypothetical protein